MPAALSSRAEERLGALARYRSARIELLGGLRPTNRDPLAEWSEHFVAELLGGTQASNPVQTSDHEAEDARRASVAECIGVPR